jgi:hypothetical protein
MEGRTPALPRSHPLRGTYINGTALAMPFKDNTFEKENLNLLTRKDLKIICKKNRGNLFRFIMVHFLGFPSNILLIIEKE